MPGLFHFISNLYGVLHFSGVIRAGVSYWTKPANSRLLHLD